MIWFSRLRTYPSPVVASWGTTRIFAFSGRMGRSSMKVQMYYVPAVAARLAYSPDEAAALLGISRAHP
jgi:hypothetical protein